MEDHQILALYFERSENAISETAKKYGQYCQYVASHVLPDELDAQECVNDTYLRAWNAIPPMRPENLRTYLGKITRNLALNRWQAQSAEKRGSGQVQIALDELQLCLPAQDMEGRILDRVVLREVIHDFLSGLRPQHRKIFLQRYWYLCSVREIAEDLAITESKVTVTLHRTRQKLAQRLQKEGLL